MSVEPLIASTDRRSVAAYRDKDDFFFFDNKRFITLKSNYTRYLHNQNAHNRL
jgi:hypothetical protein